MYFNLFGRIFDWTRNIFYAGLEPLHNEICADFDRRYGDRNNAARRRNNFGQDLEDIQQNPQNNIRPNPQNNVRPNPQNNNQEDFPEDLDR